MDWTSFIIPGIGWLISLIGFSAYIGQLVQRIKQLEKDNLTLGTKYDKEIIKLETKIEKLEEKLDHIDPEFVTIKERLVAIETLLLEIRRRLDDK